MPTIRIVLPNIEKNYVVDLSHSFAKCTTDIESINETNVYHVDVLSGTHDKDPDCSVNIQ